MIDENVLRRIRKYMLIGLAFGLVIAVMPLQQAINFSRVTEDLAEQLVIMPGEFVTNFLISGFRGLAVDIMWIQIDQMWHEGRWYEILPVLRAVTWIQPHFLEAWELGGWHLAYNLYAYAEGMVDRDKYITKGIAFLKEGLAKNRNIYDLWFNIGWVYYHKLNDYDDAIRYLQGAARYRHPSYIDRLIAHAYRRKGDIESEYRQWQHCLTVFQDDAYHIDIVKSHLEKAEEKLRESDNLK